QSRRLPAKKPRPDLRCPRRRASIAVPQRCRNGLTVARDGEPRGLYAVQCHWSSILPFFGIVSESSFSLGLLIAATNPKQTQRTNPQCPKQERSRLGARAPPASTSEPREHRPTFCGETALRGVAARRACGLHGSPVPARA